MDKVEIDSFCPLSKQEWRAWLEKYHNEKASVWLIVYKKQAAKPTISWSELVDEALCFGWIDSVRKSIDDDKYTQFFSRRKHKSIWLKINKEKTVHLIEKGFMREAGFKSIEIAKSNGSWSILDTAEALSIPNDLENKFKQFEGSKDYFESLSKSARKSLLCWIAMAKRTETKEKRILEIAENAGKKRRPKQFI